MKYIKTYENLTDNNYNVDDYVFVIHPLANEENLMATQPAKIIKKTNIKTNFWPVRRSLILLLYPRYDSPTYKLCARYTLLYAKGWKKTITIDTGYDYFRIATPEEIQKYEKDKEEYTLKKDAKKYNL